MIAEVAILLVAAVVSAGAFGPMGTFAIGQATFTGAQVLGLGIGIAGELEGEPAAIVPATTHAPKAIIPADIKNENAVSMIGPL
jgi:hypothetical protein